MIDLLSRAGDFLRARPRWQRAVAASLAAVLVVLGILWHWCLFQGRPDVRALVSYQPGGAPSLLDRDGKRFADLAPVAGQLVRLTTLPRVVPDAFVAVEDQRFRQHGAIDWRRVAGAFLADVRAGAADEGSSTITMQLARNLFPERIPGHERTLWRKLVEVRVAREIEGEFDKDEILELYLNHIAFGDGARGVEAAAQHFFGVPAAGLSLSQAALLAALPKGPSAYSPRRHPDRARERRDLVLTLMEQQKKITPAQAAEARALPLGLVRRVATHGGEGVAPYFVEEVRRELEDHFGATLYDRPLKVTTTLDMRAQHAAEEELETQLRAVESGALGTYKGVPYDAGAVATDDGSPYLQGAVVSLDARKGDVLSWVGGRDFRQSRFDRVTTAQRQAGSAFKPFVYAAALEAGHTMAEVLSDRPLTIRLGGHDTWEPRNFDGAYGDGISMREALVHSKNVATVRLAQEIGPHLVALLAQAAGIAPPIDEQPSMALGTVAVSPLEIATAYTAFAGFGLRALPRLVLKVEDDDGTVLWEPPTQTAQVMDAGAAFVVTNVLQEVITRGTATSVREAGFLWPAAGKTGTTNDGADTWFVGYTPDVVTAVWVGFDQPQAIVPRATGGRVAAPVWARMMLRAFEGRPHPGWDMPSGVAASYVDGAGHVIADECAPVGGAPRKEVFLQAHLPPRICPSADAARMLLATSAAGGPPVDSEEQTDAGLAPLPGVERAATPDDAEGMHSYAAPERPQPSPSAVVDPTGGEERP